MAPRKKQSRRGILQIPTEVILHIFSFLDLPDLAVLVKASPVFEQLACDPVLHKNRVTIIAPSRVGHSLFGTGLHGLTFRPTIGDLVHRYVMRGLDIERRWRSGAYFYSLSSVKQYEMGMRLARRHASDVISYRLRRRTTRYLFLTSLHVSNVLPDIESSSITVSSKLIPVIHQLKWSIQRDRFSRAVKMGHCALNSSSFGTWRENKGQGVVEECQHVWLALCPDIKKTLSFYESLSKSM